MGNLKYPFPEVIQIPLDFGWQNEEQIREANFKYFKILYLLGTVFKGGSTVLWPELLTGAEAESSPCVDRVAHLVRYKVRLSSLPPHYTALQYLSRRNSA